MSDNNHVIKDFRELASLKGTIPPNAANRIPKFTGRYEFLHDHYPCKIILDGVEYPSVLHAFCASKIQDKEKRLQILGMTEEREIKQFSAPEKVDWQWNKKKLKLKLNLLRQKFSDPKLKKLLLDTANAELISTNNYFDRYWGVHKGKGENHNGKLLMRLREDLRHDNHHKVASDNYQTMQVTPGLGDTVEVALPRGFNPSLIHIDESGEFSEEAWNKLQDKEVGTSE